MHSKCVQHSEASALVVGKLRASYLMITPVMVTYQSQVQRNKTFFKELNQRVEHISNISGGI